MIVQWSIFEIIIVTNISIKPGRFGRDIDQ